jgi:hypothetical protein
MNDKKRLWLSTLFFALMLGAAAPEARAQEKVDLVVLLDSSQSMFPYYNQVLEYVVSGALKEYMRAGDVFHLLSFSDGTQIEIAQSLKTESDVKSALARLYLLYPLGLSTDLLSTLRVVYQYVADLPEASAKRIILITDGMHAPLAGSPYASFTPDQVRGEITKTIGRVKERGWQMSVVRVPFGRDAAAGGAGAGSGPGEIGSGAPGAGDYLGDVAEALGVAVNEFDPENGSSVLDGTVGLLRMSYPADLGSRDYSFKFPLEFNNPGGQELSLELNALLLPDGSDALADKVFLQLGAGKSGSMNVSLRLPPEMKEGAQRLVLEPRFSDGLRVSPARADMAITLKRSAIASFFKNSARVLIFTGLFIVALTLIILLVSYVRSVHKRSSGPVVDAVLDAQALRESAQKPAIGFAAKDDERRQELSQGASAQAILSAAAQKPRGGALGSAYAAPLSSTQLGSAADAQRLGAEQAAAQAAILQAAGDSSSRGDAARLLSAAASGVQERNKLRILSDEAAKGDGSAARAALLLGSKRDAQAAARPQAAQAAYEYQGQVKKPGAARITLHVEGQNPNIGKRNIKTIHAGGKKSVGGRKSEFLIFLLPLPRHVADIHYDGESLTLVPRRPEFFPDYDGPIQDCLGQAIRLINARGKELFISFERYVPPLEKINKLLHCIEAPGV